MKSRASKVDNELVHKLGGETLVIEPWGQDGLRVRATTGDDVVDTAWALTESVESRATIEISEAEAVIRNGKISARIHDIRTKKGHVQFFKQTGDGETCMLSEYDYVVNAHNPGTRTFRPVGDGLFHTEVHFAARDDERFYGMGLNATGGVNLKGSVIDLYQRHVKHVVPFLVSSEGYGFLWNNPSLGRVELGNNRTRWVSQGCRQLDYYITAGDSYAEIMEHYADATGHSPEFPYWASDSGNASSAMSRRKSFSVWLASLSGLVCLCRYSSSISVIGNGLVIGSWIRRSGPTRWRWFANWTTWACES